MKTKKKEIEGLHSKLERMDTDYTMMEEEFYSKVNGRAMEIEKIDADDIN